MTSKVIRAMRTQGLGIVKFARAGIVLGGLVAAGLPPALAAEPQPASPGAQPSPQPGSAPTENAPTSPPPGYLPPPPPVYVPLAPALGYTPIEPRQGQPALSGDARYRSPGLAVALSLQPLPVDFGNFYAENFGWGLAYSAIEVTLMTPMMWFAGEHMDHGSGDNRSWSGAEERTMVGLVAGYVAVKVVAGLHAGYTVQSLNRPFEPGATAVVVPARGGISLALSRTF